MIQGTPVPAGNQHEGHRSATGGSYAVQVDLTRQVRSLTRQVEHLQDLIQRMAALAPNAIQKVVQFDEANSLPRLEVRTDWAVQRTQEVDSNRDWWLVDGEHDVRAFTADHPDTTRAVCRAIVTGPWRVADGSAWQRTASSPGCTCSPSAATPALRLTTTSMRCSTCLRTTRSWVRTSPLHR